MPLPRRSRAWIARSPGPRELDGEAIQLAGRRQRARQEQQRRRAGAGAPPADRVATGAGEDPGGLVVDERADGRAAELATRRPGEGIEANDRDRDLERGERRAAGGEDRVVARIGGAGAEDDRGDRDLPQALVPARHHGRLRDRRLGQQDGLHLRRGDVLAATHDAVLATIGDEQAAGVVEPPEVAGADRALGRRLAQVAGEPGGGLDDDLADAVRPRIVDRDANAGEWPSRARRRLACLVRRERRHARARLAQAVGRHDRPARVERPDHQRRRDRAAAEEHRAERRRWRGITGGVEQARELGRHQRDVARRRIRVERGELRLRVVRCRDPDRDPRRPCPPQHADPGHVREAQRQQPAGRRRHRREPRGRARVERGHRQHDALRRRRRPRGQHDHPGRVQRPAGTRDGIAAEHEDRVDEPQRRRRLPRGPAVRQRRGDGPGAHDPEDRRRGLDRCRRIDGHHAARGHAGRAQSIRDRLARPLEVGPGDGRAQATASTVSAR